MREYLSQRWRFINAGIFISEMEIYECVDDYFSDGDLSMPEYLSQRGRSINVALFILEIEIYECVNIYLRDEYL